MKNDNVKYILKLGVTLFLITAVVAAALALVNQVTEPRIAAIKEQKTQEAINAVLPGGGQEVPAGQYNNQGGLVTALYASDTGYAVEVCPAGFGGTITLMVGISSEGKLLGIQVVSHTETAGLGDVAAASTPAGEAFRGQFVGLSGELAVAKDGGAIDQITGATVTSRAVTKGINAALACVAALS